MSRCVPLALNPSAKNGLQCTFMKSSSLFWLCMSTTSKWRGRRRTLPKVGACCVHVLKIEPETGLDMYLGCNQSKGNVTLGNGHRVTTVTYDMEQFLRSCVDRYLEVRAT